MKHVYYKKGKIDEKMVTFITTLDGKVRVKDGDMEIPALLGDVDLSDLGVEPKDGMAIITHSNPTCYWFYSGGRWYVYCF